MRALFHSLEQVSTLTATLLIVCLVGGIAIGLLGAAIF
jgi:hypothetical protein